MSIINDALKKAEEESKKRKEGESPPPRKNEEIPLRTEGPDRGLFSGPRPVGKNKSLVYFTAFVLLIAAVVFGKKFLPSSLLENRQALLPQAPLSEGYNVSVPAPVSLDEIPQISLNGIVYDEEKPYAIVNNKVLLKGDEIEGVKLLEINKDSVKFSFRGREFEIEAK